MKNYFLPQHLIRKVFIIFLFITSAMSYAQMEKTYISSQTNQVSGICLLCAADNPQNIVGNDENNYETLRVPIGVWGGIEQDLNFPQLARAYRKVTMGIETPNVSIKEQAKREIYIETFKGNVSNNDRKRVDTAMLKPSSNPQKGTIEFTTTRPFDRIKLYVYSGLIGLGEEIRIYYVHHLPAPFTTCGNPPLDPLAYYSFDQNANDIISDYNLSADSSTIFQNDGFVCGGNVYGYNKIAILNNTNSYNNGIKTIAFWVKMDNLSGDISKYSYFSIRTYNIAIKNDLNLNHHIISVNEFINPITSTKRATETMNSGELVHFTIVYDEQTKLVCIYKNGIRSNDIIGVIGSCGLFNNFFQSNKIIISLINTKIDELLLYDRTLTEDEIKALACSYGRIPNCTSGTSVPASRITSSTETFTVSPNPTTGEVTLGGNILLAGSDISIRNTSGTEVYRSAFRSKTFELPSTLPGGVYMLTLQTKDKKVYTRKIILTR